jgi:hypothetical protein
MEIAAEGSEVGDRRDATGGGFDCWSGGEVMQAPLVGIVDAPEYAAGTGDARLSR